MVDSATSPRVEVAPASLVVQFVSEKQTNCTIGPGIA